MHSATDTVPVPAATAYRWTPIRPGDVPSWTRLTNLLAEVDGTEEFYDAEDLAEELTKNGVDPERDTWAVWDAGEMVGFGQLRVGDSLDEAGRVRVGLGGGVHPAARARGIGRELMDRMEHRATVRAGELFPGAPALLRAGGGLEGASVRGLLEHRGFGIVRYFNQMVLPLDGSLPIDGTGEADLAGGFRLTGVHPGAATEEAVRQAHNQAFADHWGFVAKSPQAWHDFWSARSNRMDFSVAAVDRTGRPVAYVMGAQWVPRELYVELVGTVPQARGRGLARACLQWVIAAAARSGAYDTVGLAVDSESPTGAARLYEGVGFRAHKQFALYSREAGPHLSGR